MNVCNDADMEIVKLISSSKVGCTNVRCYYSHVSRVGRGIWNQHVSGAGPIDNRTNFRLSHYLYHQVNATVAQPWGSCRQCTPTGQNSYRTPF